jgi:hypothetical protein
MGMRNHDDTLPFIQEASVNDDDASDEVDVDCDLDSSKAAHEGKNVRSSIHINYLTD